MLEDHVDASRRGEISVPVGGDTVYAANQRAGGQEFQRVISVTLPQAPAPPSATVIKCMEMRFEKKSGELKVK